MSHQLLALAPDESSQGLICICMSIDQLMALAQMAPLPGQRAWIMMLSSEAYGLFPLPQRPHNALAVRYAP